MKDYNTISRVYFIGIGGIGMSALARYFLSKKVVVSGYDKTPTKLTGQMEAEGIAIHFEDDVNKIDKNADLVIYTPAIPKDHKEFNYYKEHNYEMAKRSDVLQNITKSSFNICIAGTHGKTTISTMVAHILRHSGYGCNAFLGGISVNYDTNFWSSDTNDDGTQAAHPAGHAGAGGGLVPPCRRPHSRAVSTWACSGPGGRQPGQRRPDTIPTDRIGTPCKPGHSPLCDAAFARER